MSKVLVLAGIAWRNVLAHRVKSAIVGSLLAFGSFLVVTGKTIVDSIEAAMAESITASLAGDIQVYDKNAKDQLALFSFGAGGEDIGEITDFPKLRDALTALPQVKAVVPLGSVNTVVFGRTELDDTLDKLRAANRAGLLEERDQLFAQVLAISAQLQQDQKAAFTIAADKVQAQIDLDGLTRVQTVEFASQFTSDPEGTLDWIDRAIAPLASDGKMMYLRLLGTDMPAFSKDFSRFRIVDGQNIPEGKRGFLIAKYAYERFVKNKVARELDNMKEKRDDDGLTFATDKALHDQAGRCARQYARILFMLSPKDAAELKPLLQAELGVSPASAAPDDQNLGKLLVSFLSVDDTNFDARYVWFYTHIAPRVRLYDVGIGEMMSLRAYTKTGYMRSVNVKVWGTFEFVGLESSQLAGVYNLADLVTFRQLYGKMTESQVAELDGVRKAAAVKEVTRESAEDDLFGGGADALVTESTTTRAFDEFAGVDMTAASRAAADLDDRVYTTADMENGVVLNAAVILHEGASIPEAQRAIEAASLAAGAPVNALDWQTASGIVGQLLLVIKGVLLVAILVIFLVALFIINNSMMMATLERTAEIGTMRAIGAQRREVLALVLLETLVLATVASGLGAMVSVGMLAWLGEVGIRAPSAQMTFIFGGPRLYPAWSMLNVSLGVGSVSIISLFSTFYPAMMAASVQPVVAMNPKE
ncbi:MAG: ABC transporter permease [Myxococcales bacterium]|nr:ABC transporter permease [Myxococcales bacterium]